MVDHPEVTLYATVDPATSFAESKNKSVEELRRDFDTLPQALEGAVAKWCL